MDFGKTYRTSTETHVGDPFSLSLTSMSKTGSQLSQLPNRGTNCDRLSIGNFSEQFEVYSHGGAPDLIIIFANPQRRSYT